MARVRPSSSGHAGRDFAQAVAGLAKSGADTLLGGVLESFPRAKSERLKGWLQELPNDPGVEKEPLLFLALVCGTRFGIYLPRVDELQTELWQWLTWHPRNMRSELAELLTSALTPVLERELKARQGWRLGPSGSRTKKPGRPPISRGAWAAALVAERYLRWNQVPAGEAVGQALDLAAILTRREVAEPAQLRRAPGATGIPDVEELLDALLEQFEWWVTHDAVRAEDPAPLRCQRKQYAAWRKQHRTLASVLKRLGADSIARDVLTRIPREVWDTRESVLAHAVVVAP
jgi:hypothetical protein